MSPQIRILVRNEELRLRALANSASRGKRVSRNRIIFRTLTWLLWSWLLPFIGLLCLSFIGMVLATTLFIGNRPVYEGLHVLMQHGFGVTDTAKPSIVMRIPLQETAPTPKAIPKAAPMPTPLPPVSQLATTELPPSLKIDRPIPSQ